VSPISPAQREAIQALNDTLHPTGGGKIGIDVAVLTKFARDQPELSAIMVQRYLQAADEDEGYGRCAVALANAYEAVFDDDTLSVIVREHYASAGQPVPELQSPADDTSAKPRPPIYYAVPEEALGECDIYPLLTKCSQRHLAAGSSVRRLADLGGRLWVSFPIPDSDPRHVWQVPSVRAYVRALADAMPYFPYYLVADPRLRMFEIYFCSLVDLRMLENGIFEPLHEEIYPEIKSALLHTARFADGIGADGDACVRALLAAVPANCADFIMDDLDEALRQPELDRPGP
jgi:hypothetical protein